MKLRIPKTKPDDGAHTVEVDSMVQISEVITMNIPAILEGEYANLVPIAADDDWIGAIAVGIYFTPGDDGESGGNPPDNLAAPYAWCSNQPAGQVSVRLTAVGGNVAATTGAKWLLIGYKILP